MNSHGVVMLTYANSYEFFAPHVREVFSMSLGEGGSVDMTLLEARRKPTRVIEGLRAEPFALYFKCQSQVVLPQKMYPFKVNGSKPFNIFIVPIGREKDGIVYEAIFN